MFRLTAMSIGSLSTAVLIGVLTIYLIAIPDKPRALKHLIAYFVSVALLATTYFVRYSFFTTAAVPVNYLSDLVILGIANFLWFAFHFPTNDFPRTSRVLGTGFSVLAVTAYLVRFLQPLLSGYNFDSHYMTIPSSTFVGIGIVLGYLLTGVVLLVKTRRYKRLSGKAKATRAFALQAFLSMAIALTFLLLAFGLISRAEYQMTFNFGSMIITMAIFVSYINHSLVPVSVRDKLSGIILAVVLIVGGFSGTLSLLLADSVYHRDNLSTASQSVQLSPPRSNGSAYIARVSGVNSGGTAIYDILDPGARSVDAAGLQQSDAAMTDMAREVFGVEHTEPAENGFDYRLRAIEDLDSYFTIYRVRSESELYEVGFPYREYREYAHDFGLIFFWIIIAATVLVLVMVPLFFRHSVLAPLRALLIGVERMDEGQLDVVVPVQGRDELGRLAGSFNQMVASVRQSTNERAQLNAAYKRFVPEDLLTLLGKDSILKVQLGDQIMRNMAVMFTDIRSFTSLSEGMTPEENFRFLNQYLGHVAPVINRHNGYIDKYLGDGILCVFPESSASAVRAAIALQDALAAFNAERVQSDLAPIEVGCGIHSGSVMLGTIGEAQRMDGTVIADSVNLASRVEGLNKTLGTSILITDTVAEGLEGVPLRGLGPVQVLGKRQAVVLFEVLHGSSASDRQASLIDFRHALEAFTAGRVLEAQRGFESIAAAHRSDRPAAYYAAYCEHLIESGSDGRAGSGVLKILEK